MVNLWGVINGLFNVRNAYIGNSSIWVQLKPYLRGSDHCAWPEVTSVTCPVRKYVIRMRNRELRHIRPSGTFFTASDKVTWPEGALSGSGPGRKYVLRMPRFFRVFFLSSNMATGCDPRSLDPFGVLLVCTCGSCATPVVTEGHVNPSEVSLWCSLRRPRPITLGNPTSYI